MGGACSFEMLRYRSLITFMIDSALRRHQYENSDQFQYADGLEKVQVLQVGA